MGAFVVTPAGAGLQRQEENQQNSGDSTNNDNLEHRVSLLELQRFPVDPSGPGVSGLIDIIASRYVTIPRNKKVPPILTNATNERGRARNRHTASVRSPAISRMPETCSARSSGFALNFMVVDSTF